MQTSYDWLGFGCLIALLIAVGLRNSRRAQDFLLAGRAVGLFPLVATLVMSEFNTTTLLAFSAQGYKNGPIALGLPLIFLVGLTWYTFTVARAWKRFNRLSVAEFFTERYGRGLGRLASALLLAAMLGFSATYIKSLTLVFAPIVPSLGPWPLSLLLTMLVVLMTVSGGLVSVVRTDQVSFLTAIIVLPTLLLIGLYRHEGFVYLASVFPADQLSFNPVAQWNHPALPYWYVLSLTVLTCFTYITSPWYGQKLFAASSERVALLGVGLAAILIGMLYAAVLLAAALYRLEDSAMSDPQGVVPAMVNAWLPPFVRGIAFAVLFTTAMTTLAGAWSAMVGMCVADFFPGLLGSLTAQRTLTVLLATLGWLGANLLVEDILQRLILANIPIAALAFALLAGFHWPGASRAGAWASVAFGVAWGVGCFVYFGEPVYTWYWAIWGVPLIFAVGAAVSIAVPDRNCAEPKDATTWPLGNV